MCMRSVGEVLMCYEEQMNAWDVIQMKNECLCCALHTPAEEKFDVLKPRTHLYRSWQIFQPAAHSRSTRVLYLLRFPKRITIEHQVGSDIDLERVLFSSVIIMTRVRRWRERRSCVISTVTHAWGVDWNEKGSMPDVQRLITCFESGSCSFTYSQDKIGFMSERQNYMCWTHSSSCYSVWVIVSLWWINLSDVLNNLSKKIWTFWRFGVKENHIYDQVYIALRRDTYIKCWPWPLVSSCLWISGKHTM